MHGQIQGPPAHVVKEWMKHCDCCPSCQQDIPCGGVQAGGLCDDLCECDDERDELTEHEQKLDECGETDDGFCTLAGTEYCDFECPFSG